MSDFSFKMIDELEVGDELFGGGRVIGIGEIEANDYIYEYKGMFCTGSHPIIEDDDVILVEDSQYAVRTDLPKTTLVYPVKTENGFYYTPNNVINGDFSIEHAEELRWKTSQFKSILNKIVRFFKAGLSSMTGTNGTQKQSPLRLM